MKNLMIIGILSLFMFSCTENSRAKTFGGTAKLAVPCGQKVLNITWKDNELWYSTVPMEAGYTPRVHTFSEESSWGVMEGNYVITESNCK
jgi:hypothetical protein|tara:strand:- start:51804 stop:52073 length:270 start_codon:yes stop_codon:yes gene_type:complete